MSLHADFLTASRLLTSGEITMAVYSTDVELGVTTGVDLIAGFDAYAENLVMLQLEIQ